jgi:hypothetical protein
MNYDELIGATGVGMILLAYFLSIIGRIDSKKPAFFILNIIGAGLACYASYLISYWPFVILEGTWVIVSLYGLIKSRFN